MKLKEYLTEKGMTGTAFAAKSGISYPKITHILRGGHATLKTAVQIEKFTEGKVKPEDLLPEESN